jgi:hypothetical protein
MVQYACRRARGLLVAALGAASTLTACVEQSPVAPVVSTVVVHAVLDANTADQYVVVQRTSGTLSEQRGVADAQVTVTDANGVRIVGVPVVDSSYAVTRHFIPRVAVVYRLRGVAGSAWVQPGRTYSLTVVTGADTVRATTIVPPTLAPTAVDSAADAVTQSFIRARDTLRLSWSASPAVVMYEVGVLSANGLWYTTFATSSVSLPGQLYQSNAMPVFTAGLVHDVVLNAVDRNYFDYYRRSSDVFTGTGPVMHLSGGVGVFGSMTRVRTRRLDVR